MGRCLPDSLWIHWQTADIDVEDVMEETCFYQLVLLFLIVRQRWADTLPKERRANSWLRVSCL